MRKVFFGIMALCSFCPPVMAATMPSTAPSPQPAPRIATTAITQKVSPYVAKLVEKLSHGELKAVKEVTATGGLRAVLAVGTAPNTRGQKIIFWVIPQDRYLATNVFDSHGNSMADNAAVRASLGLKPPVTNETDIVDWKQGSPQAADIIDMATQNGYHFVREGHGPIKMSIIFDPNCIACHMFWKALTSVQGWKSKYTVAWIPVGFLKPTSAAKAATILQGGTASLTKDEVRFDVKKEIGGVSESSNPEYLKEVATNTKRWLASASALNLLQATPTIVSAAGGVGVGVIPPKTPTK